MGFDRGIIFTLYCKEKYGINLETTATLGRQCVSENPHVIKKIQSYLKKEIDSKALFSSGYLEEPLKALGAKRVDSFDYSDYENATYLHDMNKPIPDSFKGQYSLVIDGGTLEHIFNFPTALHNAMEMLEIGGTLILGTPTANYCGHGLYQFSPELFFSILQPKNGFELQLVTYATVFPSRAAKFYSLPSPASIGRRLRVYTLIETDLFICAKKISQTPEELTMQQSDYENITWTSSGSEKNHPLLKKIYHILPPLLARFSLHVFNIARFLKMRKRII